MKNTGNLLREKRESANLSISEVALATKINPKILTAIENGDTANLPAKTFLKGFIRSYALFLKMNVEEVLRTYQDESGGPTPERVHEAYAKPTESSPAPTPRRRVGDENSSGMRTAAVVVIVLLIGLIIGVRELIEKYQREKVTESADKMKISPIAQPAAVPETPPPVALDNVTAPATPASAPTPTAALPPPPAAAPTPTPTKPVEEKLKEVNAAAAKPEPPKPAPAKVEPPKAEAAKVEAPKPVAAKVEPPKPEPAKVEPPKPAAVEPAKTEAAKPKDPGPASDKKPVKLVKSEIILEAIGQVDVQFQIKGDNKHITLAPTEVHTIHADQPVTFNFSDGGAVNIILNGHERGAPGDAGKPKQVTIP